jgi:hypothetical protein
VIGTPGRVVLVVSEPSATAARPWRIMEEVETEPALDTSTPAHLGGSDLPVVLFEPRLAVSAADRRSGHASEMQAEAIIGAGFDRLLPEIGAGRVVSLPKWTVRRTSAGLELWDLGPPRERRPGLRLGTRCPGTGPGARALRRPVRRPRARHRFLQRRRPPRRARAKTGSSRAALISWRP